MFAQPMTQKEEEEEFRRKMEKEGEPLKVGLLPPHVNFLFLRTTRQLVPTKGGRSASREVEGEDSQEKLGGGSKKQT